MIDIKKYLLSQEDYHNINLVERIQYDSSLQPSEDMITSICTPIKVTVDGSEVRTDVCPNLFSDIEMFKGYTDNDTSIMDIIDFTDTIGGSKVYRSIFEHPIKSINILEKRRYLLGVLEPKFKDLGQHVFEELRTNENDMMWLLEKNEDEIAALFEMVYFKTWFLKFLNKNDFSLYSSNIYKILISPCIGILSPIMYIIVPYLVLRFKFGINVPFTQYVRFTIKQIFSNSVIFDLYPLLSKVKYLYFAFMFVFYFQGMFNSFELAKAVNSICRLITTKMNGCIKFINHSNAVLNSCWNEDITAFFESIPDATHVHLSVQPLSYAWFRNFGKQLSLYKSLNREHVVNLLQKIYIIDSLHSIVKATRDLYMTPVCYVNSDEITLKANGIWHPCLAKQKYPFVKNDIAFDSHNMHYILTGPNAGGKSTLLKSLLVNVVLSQTIVHACATEFSLHPYSFIASQINIPDCKGKQSLFEAEMYRCKENYDIVKARRDTSSLIVLDEIFNSTNPIEGIAGAFAILRAISKLPKVSTVVSTHYLYLTKLEKECSNVRNVKMNVIMNGDEIIYPYKLERGICKQYIALELLKKNGYDDEIIQDAIQVKFRLTMKR